MSRETELRLKVLIKNCGLTKKDEVHRVKRGIGRRKPPGEIIKNRVSNTFYNANAVQPKLPSWTEKKRQGMKKEKDRSVLCVYSVVENNNALTGSIVDFIFFAPFWSIIPKHKRMLGENI